MLDEIAPEDNIIDKTWRYIQMMYRRHPEGIEGRHILQFIENNLPGEKDEATTRKIFEVLVTSRMIVVTSIKYKPTSKISV
jgi:hypothetical protein